MLPIFDELNDKELSFARFASVIGENEQAAIDDEFMADFSKNTGEYNRKINDALGIYAEIDYDSDSAEKIRLKACIAYAYDFLALLMDIVRITEVNPSNQQELSPRFDLLEEFLLQKDQLVTTTYFDAARSELAAFHDPSIRDALEESLARFLDDRGE
ncbi:MAG TPA: hypothetical protein VKM55_16955 [Candidatus Lokiarchaeia archaeon]|nr:hypothetical protein [Candidatus Lokiarchaeia archaeon]